MLTRGLQTPGLNGLGPWTSLWTGRHWDFPRLGPHQKYNLKKWIIKIIFTYRVHKRSLELVRFWASHFAVDKKKESSYLPFVAQAGYGRCIFRSFKFVCICDSTKQIVMPQENGLNKMTEGKEFKFRGFPEANRSLPGGLNAVFHILYDRGKEMAMCIE